LYGRATPHDLVECFLQWGVFIDQHHYAAAGFHRHFLGDGGRGAVP